MKTLQEKIEMYKSLRKSRALLEEKLKALRDDIGSSLDEGETKYGLEKQERDLTTYDRDKVFIRMDAKGIPRLHYCRFEPHPPSIELLYLEGILSDDDLRYMRKPKYSYALVEVGEESVQAINDSISEGV